MNHLCRPSESQSFARTIIQSVFADLNFLVSNACHRTLLGKIFSNQAIEVLIGATLPTGKGPSKVAGAAQRFSNFDVPTKFFAIVIGHGLDSGFKRLERFDDRRSNQVRRLV